MSYIAAGTAVAGAGMTLFSQMKQQGAAGDALQQAMTAQAQQKAVADKQLELAQASRTDANGNKIVYIPGQGWQTLNSPATATQISSDNTMKNNEFVRQMVSGEPQRNREALSRMNASAGADRSLAEYEGGYGMPTKAAMTGRNKIAGATQATENADRISNAASGAALRTAGSTLPYNASMSNINSGATAGLRTSLAQADANADPMYAAMKKQYQDNKLGEYSTLAGAAAGTPVFQGGNAGANADASLSNAAQMAAYSGGKGSEALYRGSQGIPGLITGVADKQPNYDLFTQGVGATLAKLFKNNGSSTPTPPPYVDNQYSGRTSTGDTYG